MSEELRRRMRGALLGGAVAVEEIFAWPGLGLLAVEAIQANDVYFGWGSNAVSVLDVPAGGTFRLGTDIDRAGNLFVAYNDTAAAGLLTTARGSPPFSKSRAWRRTFRRSKTTSSSCCPIPRKTDCSAPMPSPATTRRSSASRP